jgi:hypothetical protein
MLIGIFNPKPFTFKFSVFGRAGCTLALIEGVVSRAWVKILDIEPMQGKLMTADTDQIKGLTKTIVLNNNNCSALMNFH